VISMARRGRAHSGARRRANDFEDFYCAAVEWSGATARSPSRSTDCAPYESGSEIKRRFTVEHVFACAIA